MSSLYRATLIAAFLACVAGAAAAIGGCSRVAPILSTADAVGRAVAHIAGWCETQPELAGTGDLMALHAAMAAHDWTKAASIAGGIVSRAHEAGIEVPEQVQIMLQLVAAQSIQDGMRALSRPVVDAGGAGQ